MEKLQMFPQWVYPQVPTDEGGVGGVLVRDEAERAAVLESWNQSTWTRPGPDAVGLDELSAAPDVVDVDELMAAEPAIVAAAEVKERRSRRR